MKLKLETELISEEMRVLYVALTRAKEKLIITGTTKDFNKSYKEKEDMLSLYSNNKGKIEERLLKKYTSYLDWFLLLLLKEQKQEKIDLFVHTLEENSKEKVEEKQVDSKERKPNKEEIEKIRKELEWKYEYTISSQIPTKTSVSKLKEEKNKEIIEIEPDELLNSKKEHHMQAPKFASKEAQKISSARKGTLVHLCMQKLDSNKDYTKEDLQRLIQNLVDKEIILKEEAEAIPIIVLENYLKSNLWKELKRAKEVHKEEPFYLELSANKVNKNYPADDKIMLQGIIDLYYINENDELVLVDYKTDYVEKSEEQKLIKKYREQLNLYKEALEKALNRKVDKVYIYSTWIGDILVK